MTIPFSSAGHPCSPNLVVGNILLLVVGSSFLVGTVHGTEIHAEGMQDQRVATMDLDVTYSEPFGYLSGIRELADGRVLVADPVGQVLLRIDMDAGTADTLGRQGRGPQEYNGPDQVFPLPGDSTLLVDLGNGRLIVIDPDGVFVEWIPTNPTTGKRRKRPEFVDGAGHSYFTALSNQSDSIPVYRFDRASGEETQVAQTCCTEYARRELRRVKPMYVQYDDWAVGTDGRLAVIRTNGFSVDWHFPDGQVSQGPPNDVENFALNRQTMESAVDTRNATAIWMYTLMDAASGKVSNRVIQRGVPEGSRVGVDDFTWPETLPINRVGGVRISPSGEVWVERLMPFGEPARFEVFDDNGTHRGFLELPSNSRIIGFRDRTETDNIAYVARTDNVGLIWLDRYRVLRIPE